MIITQTALDTLSRNYAELWTYMNTTTPEERARDRQIAKLDKLLGRVVFRGKRRR